MATNLYHSDKNEKMPHSHSQLKHLPCPAVQSLAVRCSAAFVLATRQELFILTMVIHAHKLKTVRYDVGVTDTGSPGRSWQMDETPGQESQDLLMLNNNNTINSIIAMTKVKDDQFEDRTIMEYHHVGYYLWHRFPA